MATVDDILMAKGPDVTVAPSETTVREAAKLMSVANVGSVIIRDGSEVKGIFTERDLLRRVVAKGLNADGSTLAEVMSSPVKSCRLEDDLETCKELLSSAHIRHVAVIEEGVLIGLIGMRDIVKFQLGLL